MNAKTFSIFDCDSHIVEPPAIWDEYVPSQVRAWVKTQFHFHTDTDVLLINGRAVPASRERANAAEVGWPGWSKKEVGALTPGTEAWKAKFGRLAGCRDPHARLADMDALGVDQVMLFPSWFVRLPLVRGVRTHLAHEIAFRHEPDSPPQLYDRRAGRRFWPGGSAYAELSPRPTSPDTPSFIDACAPSEPRDARDAAYREHSPGHRGQ